MSNSSNSLPIKISLIIPTYNEAEKLRSQLERLCRMPFHEIILVDGGSLDQSITIAKEFEITVLVSPKSRSLQMNHGAAKASGDIFLFLHADVILPKNALELIKQAMSNERTVGGGFRIKTIAENRECWVNQFLWLADIRSHYHSLPYGDQAIFVRQKIFHQLKGFPEIPLMEDIDFSKKLSKIGHIEIIKERVQVSGRRFQAHPFYYCLLVNLFPLLYRLGVKPERLAKWYNHPFSKE